MPNKHPKIWFAIIASLLLLGVLHGLVQAKPFASGYNRKAYDNFIERLLVDFRKAGFVVIKKGVKDTPFREKEPIIETEVTVVKAPDNFKKYFGELKLKNFFIQGEERQDGTFVIYLWVRYENDTNYVIFSSWDNQAADYEKEMGKAKKELIKYLFGFDCGTQLKDGFTKQTGGKFIFTSGLQTANKNDDFSSGMREFLSSFYRELKSFEFRFTLVENFPVSEIRIFGFSKSISIFLPEPETKLITVRSNLVGTGEDVKIDVFDRATRKFSAVFTASLSSGESVKKSAKSAAKKVFYNFYSLDCPLYYEMW